MEGELNTNIPKNNYPQIKIGGVDFIIRTMFHDLEKAIAITLPPITTMPKPPQEKEIIPPKPSVKILMQEGWQFYRQKNYLDALEKFEAINSLSASWWQRYQAKNAAKKCRLALVKIEKMKQREQKILEVKLKAETERKLREEKLASLTARRAQEKIQKELAEKEKARLVEAEKAKQAEQIALTKAQREAEIKAKQIAEMEARQRAEQERRQTALQAQMEAERKKQAEIAKQAEMARLAEEERKRREEIARQKAASQAMPPKPTAIPPITLPAEKPAMPALAAKKKLILPHLATVIVILIVISAAIYWINSQKKPAPIAPIIPPIEEAQPPAPLFTADSKEYIDFTENIDESNFVAVLDNALEKSQPTATFRQLVIKEKNKYLSADRLLNLLNFSGIAADNYMFFVYSQLNLSENPFEAGLGPNRLGLIVRFSDSQTLTNLINNWRDNLIRNIVPFVLPQQSAITASPINSQDFIETNYKNVSIKYLNLPNKYFSIDYAIMGDKLIFATSQESMEAVIDKLSR